MILAEEMADWGFFNAVVPRADFDAKVAFYARPAGTRLTRLGRRRPSASCGGTCSTTTPAPRSSDSKALIDRMMQLPDYVEGVAAMRERRAPRFTGNR